MPRVLSIQSSVVSGYVGNKSATFPLQLLGWDVDALHTVQFSNHTGYARFGGQPFDASHLQSCFEALDVNGLLSSTSRLLTGYIPGAEALQAVSRMVDRLKEINPELIYCLDTVMGDEGKLYVSAEVPPIYKTLLPKATIATPNAFEAEVLTEISITSRSTLRKALQAFHTLYGLPHIVISSVELPADPNHLVCAGSSYDATQHRATAFAITVPNFAEHYEGVGDVFSALVAARFDPGQPLEGAVEAAVASLQGILAKTRANAIQLIGSEEHAALLLPGRKDETADERIARLRAVELRLVDCQAEIRDPRIVYVAEPL